MLQIRLNKGPSGGTVPSECGGSGSTGKSLPQPTESGVNVSVPDHLVLADLPVAKSLGNPFPSALVKTVGRRSRRQLGERVHFCVRCDLPIAIYGRLAPCEHAFCLVCARSDSSCYLCDERIQKIQTIKMLEGIFICAAPHCLKSFLKRSLFEAHISETHADLLQLNVEKEEPPNDNDVSVVASRPSSSSGLRPKPPILPEPSISCPQSRSGPPPSHNPAALPNDWDDKRPYQTREQFPPMPPSVLQPPQLRPPLFPYGPSQDQQTENGQQMFDRRMPLPPPPFNRFQRPQQHNFEAPAATHPRQDSGQIPEKQPESSTFPDHIPPPHQGHFPPAFPPSPLYAYPPMPMAPDSGQPFYGSTPRREPPFSEGGAVQHGSLLGFPSMQSQGMGGFQDGGYLRPWNMGQGQGQGAASYENLPANHVQQGIHQTSDFPGSRVPFHGDSGCLPVITSSKGSEQGAGSADYQDEKGVLAPLPGPPTLPLPSPHLKRGQFGGPPPMDDSQDGGGRYGWQKTEKHGVSGNRD